MRHKTRFVCGKFPDFEYRIRKMRNSSMYSVTEYYKGDRIQLAADGLPIKMAVQLAIELSNREVI